METNPSEKQPVRVTILSRPYTLRTAGDPREVEALAASVDSLMLTIASKAPNADSTHIAVLASLHLADKLHTLEGELSRLKERVDRKTEQFSAVLEQLIESVGEP
jgi:cell division protein ZapA (FtsZ GTPase activity inhibitor)